ncbi:MAG: aldehyde dehydrogenase family protein, partial [Bacteroidetes bacterium]|nr:aldehyde dehydrogenase family protein [Bacteroidota bacterium]
WSKISARERGRYLYKLAELLRRDLKDFATLETLDNGKPISETLNVDLPLAIECFEYFAGMADKIEGETLPVNGNFLNYVTREPVGVVAQIIPWNFPLLMLSWKIAPALASGCTVVLKPAEQTPLTALKFAELVLEVGLPPGVINIITGDGKTGELLVRHPDIDKIAFTGSTEVGRLIGKIAGENLKRVSLELGGKGANIVFADADIDNAVQGAITGIFLNQGEICCAGSRLYIEESIKDEFLSKFKEATEKIVVGNPLDSKTQYGCQVSKKQYERVKKYITKGLEEGAKLITGGDSYHGEGYFLEPTIFEGTDDMTIAKEEIFGGVCTVLSFTDYDDVVKKANNTPYGLSAGIWTKDIKKAHRLARDIKAGVIWVNCYNVFDACSPFGGYKQSGIGREMGKYAINLYTEVKSVWVNLD